MDSFEYPITRGLCGAARRSPTRSCAPSLPATTGCASSSPIPTAVELGEGSMDLLVPEVGTRLPARDGAGRGGNAPVGRGDRDRGRRRRRSFRDPDSPKLKILPPVAGDPDRPAAARGGRLAADREGRVLPRGAPPRHADEAALLRRDRSRRRARAARPCARSATTRSGARHRRGRVRDQSGQGPRSRCALLPRHRSRGRASCASRWSCSPSAAASPSRLELFSTPRRSPPGRSRPTRRRFRSSNTSRARVLRATAMSADGQEANDIRMLKGPQTTVESVRVDVVQLHVSALDKSGRFVKGLAKEDFSIREDGKPEEMTGFELAENLPLTIGLVVDGSGSMEKSLPFVHEASVGALQEPDPVEGSGLRHRVPRPRQVPAGADERLRRRSSARRRTRAPRGRRRSTTPSSSASTSSGRCRGARR